MWGDGKPKFKVPSIGVVVTTLGRDSLARTLHSIREQGLLLADRVIVVGDGIPDDKVEQYRALVYMQGPQFEFYNREREPDCWGHGHVNYGISLLKGTVDLITVQDDDDIYTLTAFDTIRNEYEPDTLFLARVFNQAHGLLWREPRWGVRLYDTKQGQAMLDAGISAQDGHSAFFPGNTKHVPKYNNLYSGDQMYLNECSIYFPKVRWLNVITTITRPTQTFGLTLWPTKVNHNMWHFYIDPTCTVLYGTCSVNINREVSISCKEKSEYIDQILTYISLSAQGPLTIKHNRGIQSRYIESARRLFWEDTSDDIDYITLEMPWPPEMLIKYGLFRFSSLGEKK